MPFKDWVLIGENQECGGSGKENPNDDPEYFLSSTLAECAVTCAGKGFNVFAYGKSGKHDRRCYKPSESDFDLGLQIETKDDLGTDKCVCLCEYGTKEGHCRYGAVNSDVFNLYRQVTKGNVNITLKMNTYRD